MKTPDILIVDDDPGMIRVMATALRGAGRMRFATSGTQALAQLAEGAPDLVLLDADMPGLNGFEVCQRMKLMPGLADVPVIFVTGFNSTQDELRGLDAGASDFITKPISEPLLVARVRTQLRIKALTDELRAVAATDALTGAANRRSFDATLPREWRRALRASQPLSLLMLDVDHFKAYNDHLGHPEGDECLRRVGRCIQAALRRPNDTLARYGGEEFVVLLPDTDARGALVVADRVHEQLRAAALPHAALGPGALVTLSIGLCTLDPAVHHPLPDHADPLAPRAGPTADDLLRTADAALYAAKQAGRARSCQLALAGQGQPGTVMPVVAQAAKTAHEVQA